MMFASQVWPRSLTMTSRYSSTFKQVNFNSFRNIYVVGPQTSRKNHHKFPKKDSTDVFKNKYEEARIKWQEQEYKKKLRELKNLTSKVASIVRAEEVKKVSNIQLHGEDASKIYNEISSEPESVMRVTGDNGTVSFDHKVNLIAPSVSLPESILSKLGLSVKYLVSHEKQNWELVLQQLQAEQGFKGISTIDIRRFLYSIPKNRLAPLIPTLEKMLNDAGVEKSSKITKVFMEGLVSGKHVSDAQVVLLEYYRNFLKEHTKANFESIEVYEYLIKGYGKNGNIEKLSECLKEIKFKDIPISKNILSDVLMTSVYKAKDHKQAVEIFDSMKFLAHSTQPNAKDYNDIIVSYVNNDNIEKALDLFLEMQSRGLETIQATYVALARGCITRLQLKSKAWDFIFNIYDKGWDLEPETMEYMLYLASRDGDIPLSRAIFQQIYKSGASTPRSFSFLLLSYSKSDILQGDSDLSLPTIYYHENGKILRRELLSKFGNEIYDSKLPFLPVIELAKKKDILAETNALWSHAVHEHPEFINSNSANTFLNIAANAGNIEEFVTRFQKFTYLDTKGIPDDMKVVVEEPGFIDIKSLNSSLHSTKKFTEEDLEDILKNGHQSQDLSIKPDTSSLKVPRTSLTYIIALKVSAKCHTYSFAKSIWDERGKYRKSDTFKSLSNEEKDKLDFEFAAAMVKTLCHMNLLEDALALLLSTEYQFRWSWKQLRCLYVAADAVGNEKMCRTVRGIVSRGRINFEGKIRRRDYKKYVVQRGY